MKTEWGRIIEILRHTVGFLLVFSIFGLVVVPTLRRTRPFGEQIGSQAGQQVNRFIALFVHIKRWLENIGKATILVYMSIFFIIFSALDINLFGLLILKSFAIEAFIQASNIAWGVFFMYMAATERTYERLLTARDISHMEGHDRLLAKHQPEMETSKKDLAMPSDSRQHAAENGTPEQRYLHASLMKLETQIEISRRQIPSAPVRQYALQLFIGWVLLAACAYATVIPYLPVSRLYAIPSGLSPAAAAAGVIIFFWVYATQSRLRYARLVLRQAQAERFAAERILAQGLQVLRRPLAALSNPDI